MRSLSSLFTIAVSLLTYVASMRQPSNPVEYCKDNLAKSGRFAAFFVSGLAISSQAKAEYKGKLEYQPALVGLDYGKVHFCFLAATLNIFANSQLH